jgi:hypothetical protein
MKRILASAFAAVALAAWSLPATAAVDFGGQYRVRGEWRDNVNFQDTGLIFDEGYTSYDDKDQAYINQRVRLWGVAKPTDDVTVKVTIQDTRQWGANAARHKNGGPWLTDEVNENCYSHESDDSSDNPTNTSGDTWGSSSKNVSGDEHCNGIDLHESWVKIDDLFGLDGVSAQIGRQELVYGDERLIGAFGWNEYGRSFDAVKFMYRADQVDVDVFASKIADQTAGFLNMGDSNDRDQDFYGIYSTLKVIPNNVLDLYALMLRDGSWDPFVGNNSGGGANLSFASGPGGTINKTQNLYTFGARLAGKLAGVDYTVELPFQTGTIETDSAAGEYDISTWAFAAKAGYTLPIPQKIRVGAEYNMASGDDDASDNELETFFNLFPTNHGHMGHMDQQGWRNMEAWNLNATWEALSNLSLFVSWWNFKLMEEEDGWYGAGHWNNTIQADSLRKGMSTGDNDKDVGSELDFMATYKYNKAVTLKAGISRFFTDDFIEKRLQGHDDDQDWGYVELTANF